MPWFGLLVLLLILWATLIVFPEVTSSKLGREREGGETGRHASDVN